MKIDSMGNHTLVESQPVDKKEEAKKATPDFQVQPIVKERSESSEDGQPRQNKERLSHIIDFVAKSRERKAKVTGKHRIRAIRSYESIAAFEDSFVFKGRFHREA